MDAHIHRLIFLERRSYVRTHIEMCTFTNRNIHMHTRAEIHSEISLHTYTYTHNNNIHLQKFLRFHHVIQNRPTHPVVCLHTARTFLLRFPVMLHPCKLTSQSTNPNAHRLYPLLLPVIGGRRYGVFEI